MADFLLELLSEEIPARMQDKAREDLARLFAAELGQAGLFAEKVQTYATPRRLVLIARGLPLATEAFFEELKGPRVGAPDQAIDGFLRKTGLTREALTERDGVWFAVVEKAGRATADVIAEAVPAVIRAFPWPKSMRWGDTSLSTESLRWVRPLQGIIALLGGEIVPFEVAGVASGRETVGHRFLSSGPIAIEGAGDYAQTLRAAHVIVDQDERRAIIRDGAAKLAREAGLDLIEDEGLVAENAGLTEWPVPLLGRFDADFLSVPPEVIQLTARVNQKYFVCRDTDGKLANAFVCTANLPASDGGVAIVEGNRKVLAARLSDARFFYETDLKVPLEKQAEKLANIVFHEKLGTVADKVDRVAKLARWLVEEGIVHSSAPAKAGAQGDAARDASGLLLSQEHLADMAERAARLAKADLVTGMVGEFPELQGLMGGYYAAAQGEPKEVAEAIRDHYKPVGQGDDVPTAPVTVAVSLADKLDTLTGFFAIGEKPTGSKDPFALRRAAIAIVRIALDNAIRMSISDLIRESRLLLVKSTISKWQVVNIDEDSSSMDLNPVYPAKQEGALSGDVFVLPTDAEEESSINISGVSYSAYSRNYMIENDIHKYIINNLVDVVGDTVQYLGDRISESQKSQGFRIDLIRSILPREFSRFDLLALMDGSTPRLRGEGVVKFRKRNWSTSDDPVEIVARVKALQTFVETEDGANLLAGYRRAANILKKEGAEDSAWEVISYTPEPAEAALIAALDAAEPRAAAAVEAEDFAGAMAALATLRAPIDAFFDDVTVNDADPARRAARLALLARIRNAVHRVADFSRIEK